MCAKVGCKVVTGFFIVVALALAFVVSFGRLWGISQNGLVVIFNIGRFFEVMIPVLAVGALIKYLVCKGCMCGCCQAKHEEK